MEGIEGKVALSQTQVPIKTLLVYSKKDDILDFLGLSTCRVLEQAIIYDVGGVQRCAVALSSSF